MSYSSGTFTLVAGNPVVTGTTISSTTNNNTLSDIATGLTTCLLKDGTQTATALVPFAQGASVATGLFQYPASTTVGRWTTPTFSAGDYSANGSMTWTVEAADVTTNEYAIMDKMMWFSFSLVTTSVGGTPNTTLQIVVPNGKTATKSIQNWCYLEDGSSTPVQGMVATTAGGQQISITKFAGGNFSASTNLTKVIGQIFFEIN